MVLRSMSQEDLERLADMARQHPAEVITLPADAYQMSSRTPIVRVEVDGIRVLLHRALYDMTHPTPLGNDVLRRRDGIQKRNVNPFLFDRVQRTAPQEVQVCPNGHRYADVGEVDKAGYRCALCYERMLSRHRLGGKSAADVNREKTVCSRGHEYTPENTLTRRSDRGRRRCRTCERDRMQARKKGQQ